MIQRPNRKESRIKRHYRIRRQLSGTTERPRLCVYRSTSIFMCKLSTILKLKPLWPPALLIKSSRDKVAKTWNREGARAVGALIAERAKAKGIEGVVFDRGGNIYHGRIAAVADAAREAGLKF